MTDSQHDFAETMAEKRFSLKGASLVALVSGLIGVTISSMTVYADIDQRITDNERAGKVYDNRLTSIERLQNDRLVSIEAELRANRVMDARLKGIETDIQWIKQTLGGQRQ